MEVRTVKNVYVIEDAYAQRTIYSAWVKVAKMTGFSVFRHIDGDLYARVDMAALPPETDFYLFQATMQQFALSCIFKAWPNLNDYEINGGTCQTLVMALESRKERALLEKDR